MLLSGGSAGGRSDASLSAVVVSAVVVLVVLQIVCTARRGPGWSCGRSTPAAS